VIVPNPEKCALSRCLTSAAGHKKEDICRTTVDVTFSASDHLFTFLDTPGVPPDNNHAERQIRPAVIIRKNSLCNRSEQGAATQAILMSIYRTLKLRGLDATKTIAGTLRTLLQTGALPVENVADG
jgi:hypothetical protein